MPCYYPLNGYRSKTVNLSGKRSIVFNEHQGFKDLPVQLPCGRCIGCKLERSRQTAIRCLHEASLHEKNCFITLTYSPENLPPDGSLNVEHFKNFMKRLRKRCGSGVRYLHCGEYGEKFQRPHYHALLFNFDFPDRVLWKQINKQNLYISKKLEDIWGLGHCSIGDITFESAAYVARYVTKKITGNAALETYTTFSYQTGEIFNERRPEYQTASKRPAIGREWLEKFQTDVYPDDFVVIRGKRMKPPRYYNARYEIDYPEDYAKIKASRKEAAKAHEHENTWERRLTKEFIKKEKFKLLKRSYEND